MHTGGVPVNEGTEAAAGADSTELAVVSYDDQLGPGCLGGGEQAEHVGVICHASLVTDNHGSIVEADLLVVESPQQGRDVRDSPMPASAPRVRAACPETDVPTTR
jgi:hypothetical protein